MQYTNDVKKAKKNPIPTIFLIKCQQQKWEKLPKLINNVG